MTMQQIFNSLILTVFFFTAQLLPAQSTQDQYGTATYYGNEFHGKKTASGEKYDKNALTCAHRTLRFGTKLRITRLDNQKSVVVRVNDRGPFIKGYIVDLSRRAAENLGMIKEGVVKVKLEVLSEGEPAAPAPETRSVATEKPTAAQTSLPETPAPNAVKKEPAKSTPAVPTGQPKLVTSKDFQEYGLFQIELRKPAPVGYAVQVITYSNFENVFKEVAKLQNEWGGQVLVRTSEPIPGSENTTYKILLGPFADEKTAEKNRKKATKKSYPKSFIVNLNSIWFF